MSKFETSRINTIGGSTAINGDNNSNDQANSNNRISVGINHYSPDALNSLLENFQKVPRNHLKFSNYFSYFLIITSLCFLIFGIIYYSDIVFSGSNFVYIFGILFLGGFLLSFLNIYFSGKEVSSSEAIELRAQATVLNEEAENIKGEKADLDNISIGEESDETKLSGKEYPEFENAIKEYIKKLPDAKIKEVKNYVGVWKGGIKFLEIYKEGIIVRHKKNANATAILNMGEKLKNQYWGTLFVWFNVTTEDQFERAKDLIQLSYNGY